MKLTTVIRAGTAALLALCSTSAFADPVDNPGPVTFTVAAGSSAQVGCGSPFSFGGSDPPATIAGTIDGQGNITVAQADIVFQPIVLMVGTLMVTVLPVATSDAVGTLNALTGSAVATFNLEFQLSGFLIPPSCKIPAVTLNLDTGVAGGSPYNPLSGNLTGADNTFAVPASQGCGLAGSVVDSQFCLPAASGSNQAILVLTANPILTGS